jgi:hypothetical protein
MQKEYSAKKICYDLDVLLCESEITCQILSMVKHRLDGHFVDKSPLFSCLKKLSQLKNSSVVSRAQLVDGARVISDETIWELVNWIYSKTQDSSLTLLVWETAMPGIHEQLWRLFQFESNI